MPDQDVEKKKKKKDKRREADSGGNMGAGKSGKEGMGSEKPSDGPPLTRLGVREKPLERFPNDR